MKKILWLFIIIPFLLFFSIDASACPSCEAENTFVYHYTTDDTGTGGHHSAALQYLPESVSAPVYEIYTEFNGYPYIIFLSDAPFSASLMGKNGSNTNCSWSGTGELGVFSDPARYFIMCLGHTWNNCPLTGWEYTETSRGKPSNEVTLTALGKDGAGVDQILLIDTSGMTPAINADGSLYVPTPFNPYNNEYSDDIPAPEVYRDGDKIMFSNSSPDMLLLANIRWYSVDDIMLFKESLSWKYRPDSIIHSDLDWLLSVDDHYSSVNGIDLYDLGVQSFQKFLSAYPIESRTYLGGTNALGNYLFGYNDALSSLKMILGQIDSSFNAPELFFRYYVPLADGTYKCGKWTKYSRSLPSGASDGAIDGKWNVQYQVSDAPLTSDDVIGSKPNDTSGMTTYTSKDNTIVVDFDSPDYTISIDNLNQITSLFGQFPTFVSTVFCFLPSWILSLIGCTITLLVGLAVYHALRG